MSYNGGQIKYSFFILTSEMLCTAKDMAVHYCSSAAKKFRFTWCSSLLLYLAIKFTNLAPFNINALKKIQMPCWIVDLSKKKEKEIYNIENLFYNLIS